MYTLATGEAASSPSRPIFIYNKSIDPKDVSELEFAYLHAFERDHQEQNIMRLFTKFAFVYGQSIVHPSLHHAVCSYIGNWTDSAGRSDHYERAIQAIRHKLDNPSSIDEGDLFAVALLGMSTACFCMDTEFRVHVQGFFALSQFLSDNVGGNLAHYPMAVFWPMARDQLILHAYELESDKEASIIDNITQTLCRDPPETTGQEVFSTRQSYQSMLYNPTMFGFTVDGLLTTAWQQLLLLRACFKLAAKRDSGGSKYDSYIASVLAEVRANLHPFNEEQLMESFTMETPSDAERPAFLRYAAPILCLLLCRLIIIVLEAPSINDGFHSTEGITATITVTSFILRVEDIVFGRKTLPFGSSIVPSEWTSANQTIISGQSCPPIN
jgi:hypothetical protein